MTAEMPIPSDPVHPADDGGDDDTLPPAPAEMPGEQPAEIEPPRPDRLQPSRDPTRQPGTQPGSRA